MNDLSQCRLMFFSSVLLFLIGASTLAQAQSFDNLTPQRFLWKGTFGLELSRSPSDATHRIVTYLPHHTLVFYHPQRETKQIGNKEYRAVVTQFGQRLWVLNSEVSNSRSFQSIYGTQNVIFNEDGFICPREDKFCDEGSGNEINRGSVLETVSTGPDFYHLRLSEVFGEGEDRHRRISEGYLTVKRFNELERLGVLTDARKQHPAALHLGTREIETLSTRCGEEWTERSQFDISKEIGAEVGLDLWNFLSASLGISARKTESNVVEANFGGEGISTKRIEITTKRPDLQGKFSTQPVEHLYMSLEIKCIGSQNDQEAIHIRSVTVRDGNGYLGTITSSDVFDLVDGVETPSDDALSLVYSKNGRRPFLLSISSRDDYRNAIRVLMKKIDGLDVALANILLSELNATCSTRLEGDRTHRKACREKLPHLR